MNVKILTTFLILGLPLPGYPGNPINDFLLVAQTELDNASSTDWTATDMTYLSSWVEDAQIRFNTTTGDNHTFKDDSQSYEIRVKPKAWGQRDVEKNILKLRLNQKDNDYNHRLNLSLQRRYIKLLDYLDQHNRTRHLFQLSDLLSQKIELIRGQLLTGNFTAEKLLDTESMLQQSKGMATLNLYRLNAIQTQLGIALDNADSLLDSTNIDWVINIAEIAKRVSTPSAVDQSAPEIVKSQIDLQMTQAENKLIKTEQGLGINFLKFGYNDSNNDDMEFQLGINIPLGTKFKNVEGQHDLYSAQSQLNNSLASMKQSLAEIQNDASWLLQEREIVLSQIQRVQKHLQKDYAKRNPVLTLNLRKELMAHKKKNIEIHQKALTLYINYLTLTGQLIQQPLRNWIQQGTPELTTSKSR